MSEEIKDAARGWVQVIVPVVLAALAQLSLTSNQINGLDKNIALANSKLEQQSEASKDAQSKINLLNDKVSRLQFSDDKLGDIRTRIDQFEARLTAVRNQINTIDDRLTATMLGKKWVGGKSE